MKAVVYYAPGDIRVQELPRPVCGAGELLVKVDACAVCGTDLKSFRHGNPRIKAPLAMGHEFTGLIEQVGARAKGGFRTGERVVMATSISCGKCIYCRRGWTNLCVELAPMGFSFAGGMAEWVLIPELALENGHVIRVPAGIAAEHAALAEPISCAVNAAENCRLQPGDTVLVMGAGPMGLINVAVAQSLGAGKVILSEVSPQRLEQARAFGCDVVVNSATENLAEIVKAHTGGIGVDVAIVTAPAAQPQEQAVHLVRKRGTVCLFASLPKGKEMLNLDSRAIHYGELCVVGTSDSAPRHVQKGVELLAAGKIPAAKLATHVLGLDGIFRAFELMEKGEALRVVLKP